METTKDFFDTWIKSQERIVDNLTESRKKIQQALWGLGSNGEGMSGFGDFQNIYSSWTNAVMNALRDTGTVDINVIRETLSKTLSGSNAYLKLYEIWLPLVKAIREKTVSPDAYKDLTDPVKHKEMLDRLFGFDPDAVSQAASQARKFLETFTGSVQQFMKPWAAASEKSSKTFPTLVEGHPESLMKIFHDMFEAFDSTIGRIFHVPAIGKDREKIELLLRGIDDLSVYLAKNIEYQNMMYATGLGAFEKVVESAAEKIKSGEESITFDEFFDLWVKVNEKTYYALFQTEDFSKMQGELLEASLNVRKHFFKLMELYLYDFPIALRSEMDDLYKTVYEMKKRVKGLEKRLGEVKREVTI
ncbi:MAG TPA: poly(R)-hydroxyalkanoic acid synthase subunit PhaE [Thermodesulfovibrionales bacterium]|nr:poly(R)-hydroxyalkanoic acid synthase subunit PhaE [Thermodesulfovibrionales bacterium]